MKAQKARLLVAAQPHCLDSHAEGCWHQKLDGKGRVLRNSTVAPVICVHGVEPGEEVTVVHVAGHPQERLLAKRLLMSIALGFQGGGPKGLEWHLRLPLWRRFQKTS